MQNNTCSYLALNKKPRFAMEKKRTILIILLSIIIFTFLFHRQSLGLNLLIFELFVFCLLIFTRQFHFRGKYPITIGLGVLFSAVIYVINYSAFALVMNIIMGFIFIGVLIYPKAKSLLSSLGLSFLNLFNSQAGLIKMITTSELRGKSIGKRLLRLSIFIIPIIIIIIFIAIYSNSNPVFNDLLKDIGSYINVNITSIFKHFDSLILLTILLGLLISNFIWIRISNKHIVDMDDQSGDTLTSGQEDISNKKSVKNEYRSGIFLFLVLNIILLVLNLTDINWVWLNFEWEGQYLKQFVHEGTYLLILSILISMALVLFYFRGAINFFTNNKLLKYLSIIWLAQNAFLALSVAIRNFWYIEYFSLAYKRIGVFIFLLIVLYGLYTIVIKVLKKKSALYLLRKNIFAVLIVLLFSSFFNWDIIIAKYNFKHSDESFLHLNFMAKLSDKTLPYLDIPLAELNSIELLQKQQFPFAEEFMSPNEYRYIINNRKLEFKEKWEAKTFLSWNLAEYLAYKRMFKETL